MNTCFSVVTQSHSCSDVLIGLHVGRTNVPPSELMGVRYEEDSLYGEFVLDYVLDAKVSHDNISIRLTRT